VYLRVCPRDNPVHIGRNEFYRKDAMGSFKRLLPARSGERQAKCYTRPVAFCRVGYRDIEGIKHQVEVEAETLFEAVALAVRRFRSSNWDGHAPGPGCQFRVEVMPAPPIAYTVSLSKVEEFARYGAVRAPQDIPAEGAAARAAGDYKMQVRARQ
jgi:hypothetical protein